MAWNKTNPKTLGFYLVRFTWADDDGTIYREVGFGYYYPRHGWSHVYDASGEWYGGFDVTGWLPIPKYGED